MDCSIHRLLNIIIVFREITFNCYMGPDCQIFYWLLMRELLWLKEVIRRCDWTVPGKIMLSFFKQNVSCCYIIPLSFTPRYKRLDQQNTGRCFLSKYVTSLFLYDRTEIIVFWGSVILLWSFELICYQHKVLHRSPVLKNMYPYCICSLTDHSIKLLITIWTHLFLLVIIIQPASQWSPFLIAAIRICDLTVLVKQVIKT